MYCANCAFFEPTFEMSYDGECRKNPPVIDMRNEDEWVGVFPEVTADLWCGGHKRRPTKRAADLSKAGDSSQPDTVKSESVLPASSG